MAFRRPAPIHADIGIRRRAVISSQKAKNTSFDLCSGQRMFTDAGIHEPMFDCSSIKAARIRMPLKTEKGWKRDRNRKSERHSLGGVRTLTILVP